jgi:glycosyltransferase involved in cell wall biosynthesis
VPFARLVVVDHYSDDGSREVAARKGAKVHLEDTGLGYARQLCLKLADTRFLTFVDSDVEILNPDFFKVAAEKLNDPAYGAVVGMAIGHRFAYGLPASLLFIRTNDFRGKVIPDVIDARETYYLQKMLDYAGLKTAYVADVMTHKSGFRKFKPEWEGAGTRIARGLNLAELLFTYRVVVLMSLNSRSLKNIAYSPLFYLKFLRGFVQPNKWRHLERKPE